MKDSLAALTGALLIAHASVSMAASTVDLSVKGSITPSACTPSISNNGLVDHGKISLQDLEPTGPTELPKAVLKLGVDCEGASLFALASVDNRASTPGPSSSWVMGRLTPTTWIGSYFLTMQNILTDDPAAYAIYSFDNGSTWLFNSEQDLPSSTLIAFGNQTSGIRAPVHLTNVSLDLLVESFIHSKTDIPTGTTIALDGSATFELRYL
ncbi:DUF1120 domain-containing protein [Pseudomonas sp. EL_65y_Pfl1_R83]|uniref:DUF1120 domain-containing protein n=1 Tax=Pseudomonas sp. EL_65y_Pfl1_R83 TaxID=3088697 RepID=UPI0030D6EE4E